MTPYSQQGCKQKVWKIYGVTLTFLQLTVLVTEYFAYQPWAITLSSTYFYKITQNKIRDNVTCHCQNIPAVQQMPATIPVVHLASH